MMLPKIKDIINDYLGFLDRLTVYSFLIFALPPKRQKDLTY